MLYFFLIATSGDTYNVWQNQEAVGGNRQSICISLPLTPCDRTILTTIITTHIFISMLKKKLRCIYITYPTVAKSSDATAKGLGFRASGLWMWEPAARLKHINCPQVNNRDSWEVPDRWRTLGDRQPHNYKDRAYSHFVPAGSMARNRAGFWDVST